nr:efflux RND transporter periplasmic adaptor subunit [uncultured Cohaesibacter sp.]
MALPSQIRRLIFSASAISMLSLPLPAFAQAPGGKQPPTPVTIQTIKLEDIPLTVTLPGRVSASREAEVRPQVQGIVTKRLFVEDDLVAVGDPLYQIDPATYEAQVSRAKAQLAQAEAQLALAKAEEARQNQLLERKLVSTQAFETTVASRKSAEAQVQSAEAELKSAQINLDRTVIKAPLAGVIGFSQINEGALVSSASASAMAIIRTVDPVHVDVTQSAAEILAFRRANNNSSEKNREATLILADSSTYELKGQLAAADTQVDQATGVLTLRMEFANPDRLLIPGMYVRVRLQQGLIKQGAKVPQKAVMRDRRGQPIAWIVNKDNVVEPRPLTIVQDQGNQWIVSAGVAEGDRLMVDGFAKARPGAKVAPQEAGAAPAAPKAGAPKGAPAANADAKSKAE